MKPMLAAREATLDDFASLLQHTPLYILPKLDGIRCLVRNGTLYARSLKPISNEFVNRKLGGRAALHGLDGELVVGATINNTDIFNCTTRAIRSKQGMPDFTYWVFDLWHLDLPFTARYEILKATMTNYRRRIKVVEACEVSTVDELLMLEAKWLELGFEGLIIRHPDRWYKFGRSTVNEAGMLKFKRFEDSEGIIVDFAPEYENMNTAVTNELGRTARSSAGIGLAAKNTMGAIVMRDPKYGWIVRAGGFTDAESDRLWKIRYSLIGRWGKYKFFPHGSIDAPRHPCWLGLRDTRDMS